MTSTQFRRRLSNTRKIAFSVTWWKRPDLSPHDRSIVTLAALIARNQTGQMPYYLNLALDNGVKPGEISEIITHLAFYSGWENAMSAVVIAKEEFRKRGVDGGESSA